MDLHAVLMLFLYSVLLCNSTREAVYAWTIVALRHVLPKDVRRMIGTIVWDSRSQGHYFFPQSRTHTTTD